MYFLNLGMKTLGMCFAVPYAYSALDLVRFALYGKFAPHLYPPCGAYSRIKWIIFSDQMCLTELQGREEYCFFCINPFTPKSDQCQISPAPSPEISHHTVWRTWLLIAYSDGRWLHCRFSLPHSNIFSLKCWENVLFELRSERVNCNVCLRL